FANSHGRGDMSMAITDWPAENRPREKLLTQGAGTLTDAELLAIFLRVGVAGLSAVDLARAMLDEHGSLAALMAADQQRFCRTKGLGTANTRNCRRCWKWRADTPRNN